MAKYRPKISPRTVEALVREAGGKCANPGCVNYRTHIHHIQEWAVYRTHDQRHMIANCPSCHDDVHHNVLVIDDDTVYRWKSIQRDLTNRDHLYVEPGESSKLLLGTIVATTVHPSGCVIFELSLTNRLSYRLIDNDIMALNLTITTISGRELLRIVDGHVRHGAEEPVRYERRSPPG